MGNPKDLPDLTRTAAAIDAYDKIEEEFQKTIDLWIQSADAKERERLSNAMNRLSDELDRAGEAVGIAFGHDTADRNNFDDCRKLVRPGHKIPPPGSEENFLRRWVRQFKESRQCGSPS